MDILDLTAEHLEQIYLIYTEECGPQNISHVQHMGRYAGYGKWQPEQEDEVKRLSLQTILQHIQRDRHFTPKIRSRWYERSNLTIQNRGSGLSITFLPNFSPEERVGDRYKEAMAAATRFEERVQEYFQNL